MTGKTKQLALCALGAALTLALTMLALPLPGGHGYVHLGDIPVLLFPLLLYRMQGGRRGACSLAALAVALGASGADLLLGFAIYAPATLLIKGTAAFLALLLFRVFPKKIRFLAPFLACLVIPVGYWGYELLLGIGWAVSLVNLPLNALQGFIGAAGAWGVYLGLERVIMRNL